MLQLLERRGVVDRVMESLQLGRGGRGDGEGERRGGRKVEGGCDERGKEGGEGGRAVEREMNDNNFLDVKTGEEIPRKGKMVAHLSTEQQFPCVHVYMYMQPW